MAGGGGTLLEKSGFHCASCGHAEAAHAEHAGGCSVPRCACLEFVFHTETEVKQFIRAVIERRLGGEWLCPCPRHQRMWQRRRS